METTTKTQLTASQPGLRGNRGQVIALYAIALPVLLGVLALALDGGKLFVSKIHVQNTADAAALAASQDVGTCADGSCAGTPLEVSLRGTPILPGTVEGDVASYSSNNGGPPALGQCVAPWYAENAFQRHVDPVRDPDKPTGCYTWPYVNGPTPADVHWDRVEVRIRKPVDLSFANIVAFQNPAYPFARSVGAYQPALLVTTNPGSTVLGFTNPGQTHTYIFSGDTHTTTDPDTTVTTVETISHFSGGTGAVAFVMSRDCLSAPATATSAAGAAMQWSGAKSSLNQILVNGGIAIDGANRHHSDHIWLGRKGEPDCERYGGGADVTTTTGPFPRMDWPVPPPPAPPSGCIPTGTDTITATWKNTHGPGHYCYTDKLTVSANSTTFTGYSFYAPRIAVNSNSMTITNATPLPGQPPTVFYAYGFDAVDSITGLDACGAGSPSSCAFAFNGGSDNITGDIFAPNGSISLSGGGASVNGGTGFMESQKLFVSGNFSSYIGTGPGDGGTITETTTTTTIVIPGGTHTTTDDNTVSVTTDPDTVVTGSTSPGNTFTATTGTNIGLGE
jgi:hypothetical protein